MENINTKTIKGVSWTFIETVSVYFVRFFIGVVLARLLVPSDFGLIAMITIFISISDVFVNAGFGQAFIQKKNATPVDADTVFFINLALGCIVYGILYFSAPIIASFFNQPPLKSLLRVLCLVVIINALNVIQYSLIRKELQFKKKAILQVFSSVTSGIIGIACAYNGLGVWSLVVQQICNKSLMCILLYYTSTWRLSFSYSRESARTLFSYGSWLMAANMIQLTFNNFYRFCIGKLFSATDLGHYERAKQFQSMIAETFSWVFGTVAFPTFAKLQDDNSELQKMLGRLVLYSCIVVFPLLSCLFIIAKPFIILLITEKWIQVIPYLKLLCVVGFCTPLYHFLSPLLQATGNSKADTFYSIALSILRIINVVICYRYGISAIIIGELCCMITIISIESIFINNHLYINYARILLNLKGVLIITFLSCAFAYVSLLLLRQQAYILQALIPIIVYMLIYCPLIYFLKGNEIGKGISILVNKNKS